MSEYFFNNNTLNVPEFDKPNQPPVEQIDQLLENNNLMRKRLPEVKIKKEKYLVLNRKRALY